MTCNVMYEWYRLDFCGAGLGRTFVTGPTPASCANILRLLRVLLGLRTAPKGGPTVLICQASLWSTTTNRPTFSSVTKSIGDHFNPPAMRCFSSWRPGTRLFLWTLVVSRNTFTWTASKPARLDLDQPVRVAQSPRRGRPPFVLQTKHPLPLSGPLGFTLTHHSIVEDSFRSGGSTSPSSGQFWLILGGRM